MATMMASNAATLLERFGADEWDNARRCAKLLCLGLPHVAADDLVHEAIVHFLGGKRQLPRNIEPLAALYEVMRSIASHAHSRIKNGPFDNEIEVTSGHDDFDDEYNVPKSAIPISLASPEKIVQDRELIAEIERLVVDDTEVKRLILSWSEGNFGSDARFELGMSSNGFAATNRRLRRLLAEYKKRSNP